MRGGVYENESKHFDCCPCFIRRDGEHPVQLAAQGQTTHFRHYKLIDIGTFGEPASFVNPPL